MKNLNKKAGEKILSIWWFVSLIIVGSVVILVLTNHFGRVVDTRAHDAGMLKEKILDCVYEGAYLDISILNKNPDEFLEYCKLNKMQFSENSPFFFNLTVYNPNEKINYSIISGQKSYQEDCLITSEIKAKNYPSCVISTEQVLNINKETQQKELWRVYILTASNNLGFKTSVLNAVEENDEI